MHQSQNLSLACKSEGHISRYPLGGFQVLDKRTLHTVSWIPIYDAR